MPWVRIDDHFDEHPKLQQVGPLAWGVWLAGLAYCNRNLTDGFIPWTKAHTLCSFTVAEDDGHVWKIGRTSGHVGEDADAGWVIGILIDAGLWEEVENGRGRIDGYRIHDYPDYQPTKAEIEAERDAKRRAGQAGGIAAAKARAIAPAEQKLEQNPTDGQAESKPVPVPVPVPVTKPEEERETHVSLVAVPKPNQVVRANPLWDAVATLCGKPATKNERSDFGETISQINDAGALPEQVPGFGEWWWRTYPDAKLTHRCLRGHWGEHLTAPERPPQPSDLKNPMLKAIVTNPNGLADIEAELRAKHGTDDDVRPLHRQHGGADEDRKRLSSGVRSAPA